MRKIELNAFGASPADWDEATKSALVRRIVDGKLRLATAGRRYGLAEAVLLDWLRAFRRATLAAFDERLQQRLIARGVPPSSLRGAEISASLSELSVADVVQIIGLTGKSAVITVSHGGRDSRLWCRSGAIVDAESGRLRGEAAVYRILGFEQGQLLAELGLEARSRSVRASTSALILEAARRKDEAVALREKLGDPARCFELGPRAWAADPSSSEHAATLRLFQPACSWGAALEHSDRGDFETLSALCRLIEDEWLIAAAPLEAPQTASSPLVPWRPEPPTTLRWALNAVGAHVLLPAASWLGAKLAAKDEPRSAAPLSDC